MTTTTPIPPTPQPLVFTTLPLGSPIDGSLVQAGEADWFAVELAKGQLYRFEVVARAGSVLGDTAVSLLNSNGYFFPVSIEPSAFYVPPTAVLSGVVATGGTYYLKVASGLGGTGYTVRAIKLADDYSATHAGSGTLVLEAAPLAGVIDAANDRDWYGVVLEAGRGYVFNTSPGVTFGMVDLADARYGSFDGKYVYTPATSGMHYFEASSWLPGNYSVSVTRPVDDAGNAVGVDNRVLVRGQELAGLFEYDGDHDVMRTQVEAGVVYRLAAASTAPSHYVGMEVQGSSIEVLSYAPNNGEFIFKAKATGDAYVNVGGALASYAVAITKMYTDDKGNSAIDATPLAFGATLGGHIDGFGDVDAFELTVEAGKSYEVIGHSDIGSGFAVSDMDPYVFHPEPTRFSFTASESGKHVVYVSAQNKTGAYSVTLAAVTNDTLTAALDGGLIDPGAGFDSVRFAGALADYTLVRNGAGFGISKAGAGSATLAHVERVLFAGSDALALDVDGIGGTAYRLYRAAFDRAPDKAGVGFWMNALEDGVSQHDIAQAFIASAEFTALYGANVSNADFVTRLYANILDRAPDAGGFDYWLNALNNGYARADVLANFSESDENADAVAALIGTGFAYIPFGI